MSLDGLHSAASISVKRNTLAQILAGINFAEQYPVYASEKPASSLVELFKSMHIDEEEAAPVENGDLDHEELEENGEDQGEVHTIEEDSDSMNGVVLVNGTQEEETKSSLQMLREVHQHKINLHDDL